MKLKPKPGDIIFSRKSGPLSLIIRWLMGPFPYSHACLVADPPNTVFTTGFGGKGKKTWAILPASEFRQLPMSEYLANKKFVVCRYDGLTEKQRAQIIKWCQSQLGKKYPFRKTLKLFTMLLKGKGINRVPLQPNQQHCYEFVAKAYSQAGILLDPRANNLDPSGYDIKEIYLSPKLADIYAKS